MSSTAPPSLTPGLVPPPAPPCSPYPSPPCSPGPASGSPGTSGAVGVGAGGVILRSPATRHLRQLDPWRRHSWEPGAVPGPQQSHEGHGDSRSVSLEHLDQEEMEKVMGLLLGVRRGRDLRRAAIRRSQEGSLSSLTEEEAGEDPTPYSLLEEQAAQLQGCSASAPTLSMERRAPPTGSTPRPRSTCYETSPQRQQLGGSTQSVDVDVELLRCARRESWTDPERDEEKEEEEERSNSPLGRTLSFLRKMATRTSFKRSQDLSVL